MSSRVNFEKFHNLMVEEGYGGALVSPGSNLRYLTGLSPSATLERLFLLIVPAEGEPIILAPKMYEEEVSDVWFGKMVFWEDGEDPYRIFGELVRPIIRSGKSRKWLVEDSMPAMFMLRLREHIGGLELHLLSSIISNLRMFKSSEEVEYVRRAAEICRKVLYKLVEEGVEGKSERELAAYIEYLVKSFNADVSFEPIVASGPNGANPHHTPSSRVVRRGDLVVLDFGARYKGYCSDITRTLAIGEVDREAEKVYEIVEEAQQAGLNACREGVEAGEVDLAVRKTIGRYGYEKYFTHRTGHGLGLDIHEEPYIAPNSKTVLKEGMIFTIEPGIYLPRRFGVRVEDDVVIEGGRGVKVLEIEHVFKI